MNYSLRLKINIPLSMSRVEGDRSKIRNHLFSKSFCRIHG
jgi:hypothetical protein